MSVDNAFNNENYGFKSNGIPKPIYEKYFKVHKATRLFWGSNIVGYLTKLSIYSNGWCLSAISSIDRKVL